jgi:hypothetical protein
MAYLVKEQNIIHKETNKNKKKRKKLQTQKNLDLF